MATDFVDMEELDDGWYDAKPQAKLFQHNQQTQKKLQNQTRKVSPT